MTIRSRHIVFAVLVALVLGALAGLVWRSLEGPIPPGERARDTAATARGAAQRATQGSGGPAPSRP